MRARWWWWGLVLLILLELATGRELRAVDPADGTMNFEEPLHLPKFGRGFENRRTYEWAREVGNNARRPERGTLAARPTCSTTPPTLVSKLYIVTDCTNATCNVGGGSIECLTKCNEAGNAWEVGPCEVGATGATGPTGPTGATGPTGSGVTDGDKGDIVVSSGGTVWSYDGILPLSKLTDDATSGKCLLSGGAGDPNWATCPGGGVTDHGALTGLADDDHTQYALLAGRAAGQTLAGTSSSSAAARLILKGGGDLSSGPWNGSGVGLGASGSPDLLYLSQGDLTFQGTWMPVMITDSDMRTWTATNATCTADASVAAGCTGPGVPNVCCTGAGTGPNCGYCNGSGLAVPCDTSGTYNLCGPVGGVLSQYWRKINFTADSNGLEAYWGISDGPQLTGSGAATRTLSTISELGMALQIAIPPATTNLVVSSINGLYNLTQIKRFSGGSQTATVDYARAVWDKGNVDTGGTVNTWEGIACEDAAGAGTITTRACVDIPANLAHAGTAMSLRSVGAQTMRHEGGAIFGSGSIAPAAQLDVREAAGSTPAVKVGYNNANFPSTAETRSMVELTDTVTMNPNVNPGTPTTEHALTGLRFAPTVSSVSSTLNDLVELNGLDFNPAMTQTSGSYGNTASRAVYARGTYTAAMNPTFGMILPFDARPVSVSNTVSVQPQSLRGFTSQGTVKYNVASGISSTSFMTGFQDVNTIQNVQAGGLYTLTNLDSFVSYPAAVETAGDLYITYRRGMHIYDVQVTGSPTIDENYGLDIEPLTVGTKNIGIRNAAATVETPSASQTISAVSNTILCNATVVQINNAGACASPCQLTSNPVIAAGLNGQRCTIVAVGTTVVTLPNGNNLSLPNGAALAVNPGDTVTLVYNSLRSAWVTQSAFPPASAVDHFVWRSFFASVAGTAGTTYWPQSAWNNTSWVGNTMPNATEINAVEATPIAVHATRFCAYLQNAPGASASRAFTLRSSLASTALTCTISGASQKDCCSTGNVALGVGAPEAIMQVNTGTVATSHVYTDVFWTAD